MDGVQSELEVVVVLGVVGGAVVIEVVVEVDELVVHEELAVVVVVVLVSLEEVDVVLGGWGRFGNTGWSQQLLGSACGPDCGVPSKVIAIRPPSL